MYSVPDQVDVTYQGATSFTTGALVSGGATIPVNAPAGSTQITVSVKTFNEGALWDNTGFCPTV